MNKTLTTLVCLLGFAASAQAHHIWIEQPAGQSAVLHFGEFGDNLRETSPDTLAKLGQPKATLITAQGEKSADGSKVQNGYTLPFTATDGAAIVAEGTRYPLYTYKKDGKELTNRWLPAARLITGMAAQQPKLTLDLVPTGRPGEFKLTFEGKPLPKKKVTLMTQSGWGKDKTTDAQGLVQFDMPWKGPYVAEVSHDSDKPGQRQGPNGVEKYDGVNYVTSLTYVKPDGIAPIPAGPAGKPHQ